MAMAQESLPDNSSPSTLPPTARPRGQRTRPFLTAAAVIYTTLGLLAVTIPQSLVNRVRDINNSAIEEALLPVAEALQSASQRAGLAAPYQRARALFLAFAGKEEN
jgi:hypothetical protein